ncbi:MAG TPA: deoxyribose-phosphate aldolase [candidate division Zixibacteria bacterium]
MDLCPKDMARFIDHTLLKPEATEKDIRKLCEEAKGYGFASVCANPIYVTLCQGLLRGSNTKTCTVVDFPLGANKTEVKVLQTKLACQDGAEELDMVANLGALKAGDLKLFEKDIKAVVDAKPEGVILKVIIETAILTDNEKKTAASIVKECGADFVKTSTGFGPAGANVGDIALLRKVVGEGIGVKASGGIRTYAQVLEMIKAGANRIGTSASVQIMESYATLSDHI